MGLLSTAESVGDILGAQVASLFTEYFRFSWHYAYFMVGMLCLVMMAANFFFLIKHPSDVGIDIP